MWKVIVTSCEAPAEVNPIGLIGCRYDGAVVAVGGSEVAQQFVLMQQADVSGSASQQQQHCDDDDCVESAQLALTGAHSVQKRNIRDKNRRNIMGAAIIYPLEMLSVSGS